MSVKIFHSADIQINVEGRHYNRYNEYEWSLTNMANIVINDKYDIAVLAGDLFERCTANETEKTLLVTKLLQPILNAGITILWTDGNHDLKQSNFTFDPGDGSTFEKINVLKSITAQINNDLLIYAEDTGFYSLGTFNGQNVIAAVWAHKSKYSAETKPLNPWFVLSQKPADEQQKIQALLDNAIVFNVFHDPVKNSKNFDGKIVRGNNDARVDIAEFKGAFALMGDIHMPDIMRLTDRPGFFATYPSSPIICYFSEGDYYINDMLVASRNNLHGYNSINAHMNNVDTTIEFVQLQQYSCRHTITINADFTEDRIEQFKLINASNIHNFVKIVVQSYQSIELLDALIKHLNANYVCTITTETPNVITGVQTNLNESFNLSELSNKKFLMTLATMCITDKVNASKDTDDVKALLLNETVKLFESALDNIEYAIPITKYTFGNLKLKNFMPINELHINFNQLRQLNPIVKINGNNGTGKTTIFKGISWVATGKIDWRQADNKTKQNNLDYFNDKAYDDDITEGYMDVQSADEHIEISRKLTRFWNAKATDNDKKSLNWKTFITSVNSELQVKVNDVVLSDNDAQLKLFEIFGDFFKFSSLHIINQASLDHMLLNLPLNQLIDHILKSIGFTAVEQLHANQDDDKKRLFKNLTKHGKDIAGINIDINICDNQLTDNNNQIAELHKVLAVALESIQNEQNDISQLQQKKHQFNDDVKALDKTMLSNDLNNKQKERTNLQNQIDNPAWNSQKESELFAARQEIAQKQNDLTAINAALAEIDKQLSNLPLNKNLHIKSIADINTKHTNAINATKQQLALNASNSTLAYTNKSTEIVSAINAVIKEHNDAISKTIDSLKSDIDTHNNNVAKYSNAISVIDANIDNRQKQIDDYNAGACAVCDKAYNTLPKVKESIAVLDNEIVDFTNKKTTIQNAIDKANESILSLNQQIESQQQLIAQSINNANDEVSISLSQDIIDAKQELLSLLDAKNIADNALNEFSEDKYPMSNEDKLSIETISKEIEVIDNSITELQNNRNISFQKQNAILNDINSKNVDINTLEELRKTSSLELLYKNLNTIDASITQLTNQLATVTKYEFELEENRLVDNIIQKHNTTIAQLTSEQDSINSNIAKLTINNATLESKKLQLESIIDEIKQYEYANTVWKLFQHTISNKGLNKYVFDSVAMQINSELNNLLDGLNYRIYFDLQDNYTLKMVDLLGQASIRNLYTIGGMESTLGALSLVAIIKSKTIKNNGDFIFIDEITGKLNNAKDTKGTDQTNKDYQYEFFTILQKLSANTNIAIIDHVLPIDWFKGIINVIKYDNGKSELV